MNLPMNGATSRANGRLTVVSDPGNTPPGDPVDGSGGEADTGVDQLVARVAQGDDTAFASLYDRTSA
ncbi:MAG TPA: hypothetical protein VMT88_00180, partial [Actinomycetes bacterium]|nr:hypothetical protein [Actinomycetes bacterium]